QRAQPAEQLQLGGFCGHRSLVSTDGGDVTKATKHEGNRPGFCALVASATNVNKTNFAIEEISDSLPLTAPGKSASYFIQRQSDLHRQATVSRLRIDGEME